MKVKLMLIGLSLLIGRYAFAQEEGAKQDPHDTLAKFVSNIRSELDVLRRLKITGYIQPQFQVADSAGVGSYASGNFASNSNSRYMLRRGRIKFTYENGLSQFVLQTDMTEKGVFIRETYARITEPWTRWFTLTMGVFQHQFGFELTQSSSVRETPERARMMQTLFPVERDLGAWLTIQAPKTSNLHFLKLDLGLTNGAALGFSNGAFLGSEFDTHKDVTGRLSFNKVVANESIKLSGGISYYNGGWRNPYRNVYTMTTNAGGNAIYTAKTDTANTPTGMILKREYMGADIQMTFDWWPGTTTIRAEYMQGQQPGLGSSSSTSLSAAPTTSFYMRNFNGGYIYFIQHIGSTKHEIVAKYDWYDPNTKVNGSNVGKATSSASEKATGSGDIMYSTIGLGYTYYWDANVKFVFYYDMVTNETTSVKGFTKDLPDNVLTFRLQYKF